MPAIIFKARCEFEPPDFFDGRERLVIPFRSRFDAPVERAERKGFEFATTDSRAHSSGDGHGMLLNS